MKRWKKGFTLMEVLLATVIIALGFIAGAAFYYANRKNLYNARIERYATWSAIEKIEEVKGKSSLQEEETTENITLGEHNIPAKRILNITEPEDDDLIWKVEVKVRWEGNKEVSLNTYLSK
ncbi:MAG TPA: prepilin-type N-terminal cleavage/methylation domain-containing protein [bacterium]|nr:prepilin-type N-terminal cleavage/methylation domain-containing protein [bacterium]HPP30188.1 prepilin-type N-terminal cleavage/methylation domain-containing protein [bacterium]